MGLKKGHTFTHPYILTGISGSNLLRFNELLGICPLNAKLGERGDSLFHGQADHVCMRAFDTRNDLGSITLCGVSARFIERIHFREVVVDRSVVQASKSHTRNLVKHRRSGASEVKNENR